MTYSTTPDRESFGSAVKHWEQHERYLSQLREEASDDPESFVINMVSAITSHLDAMRSLMLNEAGYDLFTLTVTDPERMAAMSPEEREEVTKVGLLFIAYRSILTKMNYAYQHATQRAECPWQASAAAFLLSAPKSMLHLQGKLMSTTILPDSLRDPAITMIAAWDSATKTQHTQANRRGADKDLQELRSSVMLAWETYASNPLWPLTGRYPSLQAQVTRILKGTPDESVPATLMEFPDWIPDQTYNPERILQEREALNALFDEANLTPAEREVTVCLEHGMTQLETAHSTGRAEGTVKALRFTAYKKLRAASGLT